MRADHKLFVVLALAALLAFGLSACGGGDDDSTQSQATTAADGGQGEPGTTTIGDQGAETTTATPDDDGGEDQEGGAEEPESEPSSEEGSASFRVKGGDNSIQNYGEEADSSEVEEVNAILSGYLDARAAGQWAKSCTYLAATSVQPLQRLAESSPKLEGKGCGAILGALSAGLPKSARASSLGEEGIASLRAKDEQAFALYHGTDGKDYFVPMRREGDEWKVGSMIPTEFP
jgi:hypothetical protein